MGPKETESIWIGVVLVGLIVGAYYFGMASKNSNNSNNQDQVSKTTDTNVKQSETDTLKNEVENLKNPKQQEATKETPTSNLLNVADITKEWAPRIAFVTCSWHYGVNQPNRELGNSTGSATLVNMQGLGITAVTNWHVLTDSDGSVPSYCGISVWGTSAGGAFKSGSLMTFFWLILSGYDPNNNPFKQGDGDVGYMRVNFHNNTPLDQANLATLTDIQNITASTLKVCADTAAQVGDKILILGYPSNGSGTTVTATEGIISGFDGRYFVTDAKIDHGSSGGAAILVKNDCYLGIPSAAIVGTIESYGRILSAKYIFGQ